MPNMKQLSVMVVDDTTVSRALLTDGLDQIGLTNFKVAKDGEEALKMMVATPCHLVISDLNMPKVDGMQLLRALRQHGPTSKVGFILVTGKGDRALIEEGKKYGLNNFLAKPFTVPNLKACIEAVVGKLT
ncbi:MAG: response regulator [Hyphomicrobium sp.]|nr:response regulator [Hyphomicrobium sp.]